MLAPRTGTDTDIKYTLVPPKNIKNTPTHTYTYNNILSLLPKLISHSFLSHVSFYPIPCVSFYPFFHAMCVSFSNPVFLRFPFRCSYLTYEVSRPACRETCYNQCEPKFFRFFSRQPKKSEKTEKMLQWHLKITYNINRIR